ncbi:MAG: FimV/HubP family polar landmark protein, partial [Pseudomonadaceae bacterium]
LRNALNDEPQRSDLRLKLMEVYAELGDRDGFARQESELREIGGAGSDIERLKLKYPAIATTAAVAAVATHADLDNFDLDDLQFEEQVSAQAAGQDPDDAFDLSLDDLDIDLDSDQVSLTPATPVSETAQPETLDFDDLSFDEPAPSVTKNAGVDDHFADLAEESPLAASLSEDLDDFSFDLGAEEQRISGEEGQPSVESFSFDLNESLEDVATSRDAKADEELLSADFDLSLDQEPVSEPQIESAADQLDSVDFDLPVDGLDVAKTASSDALNAEPESAAEEDDFNFFSDTDEATTKLDLARAYIDMGDAEGARDILDEVLSEGSEQQQQEAREMLAKLV